MARQQYYSTKDIQSILAVSRTTANRIMHEFEHAGKLLRHGNTLRIEVAAFETWCRQHTSLPAK